MPIRRHLVLPLLTLITAIAPVARAQSQPATVKSAASGRPNVIMIFSDDLGYGDISSFADKPQPVKTPNIDRLAREGMKFGQFYVASPVCSPSRAAVLSGRFASETGLKNFLHTREHNRKHNQDDWMDPSLAHLPRAFNDAGYATAHIGKWHVGGGRDVDNAPSIGQYGYDEWVSTTESPDPDPKLGLKPEWVKERTPGEVKRYERTGYMVDRTVDFLKRHQSEPCFVTLWTNDVHAPYHPSPAMQKKHGGTDENSPSYKNFLGVLEDYDREIGRLLDSLKEMGMEENTIVFFTGDNGPEPHAEVRNAGLRGRKMMVYEGGIRQPFLIRWPAGKIPAGAVNDQTVLCAVDLLPTLTSLAGVPLPEPAADQCDGEDLSAATRGEAIKRTKPLYWENMKMRPDGSPRGPKLAIRKDDWKLLMNHSGSAVELFDLSRDPYEKTNLADQHPDRVKELSTEILAWAKTLPSRRQP